jgi:hypothetical protein
MFKNLALIFDLYGGTTAFFGSSYLRSSILITALFWRPIWTGSWPDLTLQIIPSVMGFSIAAVAIVTVIGDDGFRRRMAAVSTLHETESDLVVTLASFVWFIVVQVTATLGALVFKAKPFPSTCSILSDWLACSIADDSINAAMSAFGMLTLVYAILLIVASVMQTFHLFRLYVRNPD